jgi:hypothetical protein
VFDANVPHNTQVARGTLSLVGPVDLRRLTPVGEKATKSAKGAKGTKSPKGSKGTTAAPTTAPTGWGYRRRMLDMGDRRLTLQYMTDRFKEEGSVRPFVDSLGYKVDLNSGTREKENALAKEDCERLMSFIDHDSYSNVDEPDAQDIEKYIDESDLVSVIGKVSGGYHGLCLSSVSVPSVSVRPTTSDLTLPTSLLNSNVLPTGKIHRLA